MTRVYGVMGHPVAHSRSPAIHRAAFDAAGIDAVYGRFDVAPSDLEAAMRGARALGIAGLNVTLPHKEAVMAHLDAIEADARAIGAVNTIAREGDRLVGLNTDAPGLVASLREAGVLLAGARVLVVGAGGAARASIVGLARAGAAEIVIAARREPRAAALAAELAPYVAQVTLRARSLASLSGIDATLVVQATSATLDEAAGEALTASLPLARAGRDTVCVDLVYQPRRTVFLRAAEAQGLRTIEGLGMLLHQAALAWTRWTGRPAPLDAMRAAIT